MPGIGKSGRHESAKNSAVRNEVYRTEKTPPRHRYILHASKYCIELKKKKDRTLNITTFITFIFSLLVVLHVI